MKNAYFKKLPLEIQDFFKNYGFFPKNYTQANNFIKSVSHLNENRTIVADYKFKGENKKIEITKKDYKLAFFPPVWKNLSIEDRVFITHCAFKDLCKQFNIEDKYNFILIPEDTENFYNLNAAEFPFTKELFLNFYVFHLSKGEYSLGFYDGLLAYSTLSHEVNHMKQSKHFNDIIKYKLKAEDLSTYKKSLKFCSGNLEKLLTCYDAKDLIDENHLKRFNSTKINKLKDAVLLIYYANLLEISSGNIQSKYFKNLITEVYDAYGIQHPNLKFLNEVYYDLKNQYNYDQSQIELYGCTEFVNKINALIEIYFSQLDILDIVYNFNQSDIEKIKLNQECNLSKDMAKLINKQIIRGYDKIEKKLEKCLEAIIDLFYFEKQPKFNEEEFKLIDKEFINTKTEMERAAEIYKKLYLKAQETLKNKNIANQAITQEFTL